MYVGDYRIRKLGFCRRFVNSDHLRRRIDNRTSLLLARVHKVVEKVLSVEVEEVTFPLQLTTMYFEVESTSHLPGQQQVMSEQDSLVLVMSRSSFHYRSDCSLFWLVADD
jgi:hypothetical protein